MLDNIKGAIFDMDGTLIDSMWVWEKIDVEYLKSKFIPLPKDLKSNIEHLSFIDTAKYFKNRFNLSDSIEEIIDEWSRMAIKEYSHNVKLKPGAREYLVLLKSLNIKIALATSNSNLILETVLKNNGVLNYFDAIATTDEVDRGKDFPDIYLHAAKKLGVLPEECIVFEDILPAVMGAKAAGMMVVGVYDSYSEYQKEEIINAADKYILKYEELIKAI